MPQRIFENCTVPECTRKHKAAGYCASHYQQWRRGVPITGPVKARDRHHAPTCSEPDCSAAVKAKGLCKMHYARLLRHGFTRNPSRQKPFQSCLVEGCNSNRYAQGLCNQHYLRERDAAKYGLSLKDLAAIHREQEGLCAICHCPSKAVNGWSGKTVELHIDHDHATGAFRGLLCPHCNRAIGLLQDDTKTVAAAIAYLGKHSADPVATLDAAISQLQTARGAFTT